MKRLIIARHGNTFFSHEKPTRVGARTDLPLVDDHLPRRIGRYLSQQKIELNNVYAAPLKRTMQTAELILNEMSLTLPIKPLIDFLEIDYGPDENKCEDEVIARLGRYELEREGQLNPIKKAIISRGEKVIENWNKKAQVPPGWQVDTQKIIKTWCDFATNINEGETALVVTSNGIIRFAPQILNANDYENLVNHQSLKVKTGSIAIFTHENNQWYCNLWNKRP